MEVAFEQEGADRARYGVGLIDALAASFKSRGVLGLSGRNLRNYRQVALTWPLLGRGQTRPGDAPSLPEIWQTLSAGDVPTVPKGASLILCAEKDAEVVHYATGNLEQQVFVSRYLTRLPTEAQLKAWLADERELLARQT
jgi:hypothetical protein